MGNVLLGKTCKAMYKLSGKTISQLSEETDLSVDTINNLFYARIQKPGFDGVTKFIRATGFHVRDMTNFLEMAEDLPETADITEDLDPAAWHPWEECHGISHAYGNHWQDDETSVMGNRELVVYFTDIVARGGNLLLLVNLGGPGRIPEIQRKRLEALGRWLDRWGGAIYGTRPLAPFATKDVHYLRSKDATSRYAVVIAKSHEVELECEMPSKAVVRVFGEVESLPARRENGKLVVEIPERLSAEEMPYVLEIVSSARQLNRRLKVLKSANTGGHQSKRTSSC